MLALQRRMSWSSSWPKRARLAMILAASVSSSMFGRGSTNTAAGFSNRNAALETRATGAESGLRWTRASPGRCRKCSCVYMKKGWSIGGLSGQLGPGKPNGSVRRGSGQCGAGRTFVVCQLSAGGRFRSDYSRHDPPRKRCWGIRRSPYIRMIRAIPTSSGRRWCFRLRVGKFPLLRTSMSKWISAAGR